MKNLLPALPLLCLLLAPQAARAELTSGGALSCDYQNTSMVQVHLVSTRGGLKEKTMAAFRAQIKTVIIPAENAKDLEEIDKDVRRALSFVLADSMDDVLSAALDFSERPDISEIPAGDSA